MTRQAVRLTMVAGLIMAGVAAVGCAGKGETRHLKLDATQVTGKVAEGDPVKIVVTPFEDRRPDKTRVGLRTHLWGGETNFNVVGERPGDAIAKALVDRLKTRGWRERAWNARLAPNGSAGDADIVITGQVQEFSAHAKGRVFSTVINAKSRLVIQAKNLADGSTTTRNVEGVHGRTVIWFDQDDVQDLLVTTMMDGIDRLINDTVIEQKALRPAR